MNLSKKVLQALLILGSISLTTSSVYASITITSPNGGENWSGTKTITWTSVGTSGFVNIYRCLTLDCSSTSTVATNVTDTGSSTFDTSGLNATNKIYIEDASDTSMSDVSDNTFRIDNTISSCNASIGSNNTGSARIAKVGDLITVNFDTCESISLGTVTFFGKIINATNIGGNTWSVSTTTTMTDDEGLVSFNINYTDLAGNSMSRSSTVNGSYVIYDKTFPESSISFSTSTFTIGSMATATITFNEKVRNFANDDIIRIDNGTLSTATSSDDGITWTAIFTPTDATSSLSNVVVIDTSLLNDIAGNTGTSTATSSSYIIDTERPTATTSLSSNSVGISQTITLTITFNEKVRNFANDDIIRIDNGTLSTATSSDDGITWNTIFTPTLGISNTISTIAIGSSYTDIYGNTSATGTVTANFIVNTPTVSQSGGGGFSGGGGGGSVVTVVQQPVATTTQNQNTAQSVPVTTQSTLNLPTVLGASIFIFSKNLKLESTGNDVMELQKFLTKEGFFSNKPTKYFGRLTKIALMKWQKKNNLPATGYFGPMSRVTINSNSN